jgi:predicted GNAT superfamily acetyltransferase
MAESLKERQARLADRLKSEPPKAPIQEVNPVVATDDRVSSKTASQIADDLVQFNVKIPKQMAKAVKQVALDDEVDIRDVVRQAIDAYLKKRA